MLQIPWGTETADQNGRLPRTSVPPPPPTGPIQEACVLHGVVAHVLAFDFLLLQPFEFSSNTRTWALAGNASSLPGARAAPAAGTAACTQNHRTHELQTSAAGVGGRVVG